MNKLVSYIDAVTDRISSFGAWLVVPLFLIMGYEVFARFLLQHE